MAPAIEPGAASEATARPAGTHPRRWLAVLLSLLSAGLGQMYAGRPLRALSIAVAVQLLAPLAAALAGGASVRVVWRGAAVVTALVVGVLVAIDAAKVASRPRARFFTRRAVLLACGGFLLALIVPALGVDWAQRHGGVYDVWDAKSFRVPSGSMLPTLLVGDHFFVDAHAFQVREPRRGEAVVFEVARSGQQVFPADLRPDLPREPFVKRIIGLPGDRITIQRGTVIVNGEPLESRPLESTFTDHEGHAYRVVEEKIGSRAWRILDDPAGELPDPEPITVAEGRYYVLGDNRDHALDSRYWGSVARSDLVGPLTEIYWSWDFNGRWADLLSPSVWLDLLARKTRWDRIGLAVD